MIVTRKMAEEAAATLHIQTTENFDLSKLPAEAVHNAYRHMAKAAHPDTGGSAEAFASVDRAKHVLLKWLEKGEAPARVHEQNNCTRCHGKGYVVSQRAFKQMRVMCPLCRGTGDADYEHERSDTGVNR